MPIKLNPHVGKGGTGFQGTGSDSAAFALSVLASQQSVAVSGGASGTALAVPGMTEDSVVLHAIAFDTGVPSVITGNVSGQAEDEITFDVSTADQTVLVMFGNPA